MPDAPTLIRVKVLKELPQGQQPGTYLDVTEEHAKVLLLVGAVERAPDDGDAPTPRRTYRRRDLTAEK